MDSTPAKPGDGDPDLRLGPRQVVGKCYLHELWINRSGPIPLRFAAKAFDKLTIAAQGKRITRAIDRAVAKYKAER